MLKILEKNLLWQKVRPYWRQFAGWGTDLRTKYVSNIFFRTEFNVIALQIVFAGVLSVMVVIWFNYLYKDILETLLQGISENIRNNGTVSGRDILSSMQVVKAKNFLSFFSVAVSITLIFSYLIARLTLSPARDSLKAQKRFVSDIAHELRTPLSVIKTSNEVALLDETLSEDIKSIFKSTIEELDRTSGIINNLLTFSNLVHPEQIRFAPVNMGEVVDLAITKLDELVKKKEIKMTVRKISPYLVLGNSVALEQIVINLIKNAINYNIIGGLVSVTLEPDYKGSVVLTVEDNGIGISQYDLLHIFEPFYRAERSRNRQSGSSGLGLTIVSELIKLHSGKIRVRSNLKQGTEVTITLPYSISEDEVSDTTVRENEVSVDFLKGK